MTTRREGILAAFLFVIGQVVIIGIYFRLILRGQNFGRTI